MIYTMQIEQISFSIFHFRVLHKGRSHELWHENEYLTEFSFTSILCSLSQLVTNLKVIYTWNFCPYQPKQSLHSQQNLVRHESWNWCLHMRYTFNGKTTCLNSPLAASVVRWLIFTSFVWTQCCMKLNLGKANTARWGLKTADHFISLQRKMFIPLRK